MRGEQVCFLLLFFFFFMLIFPVGGFPVSQALSEDTGELVSGVGLF